MSHLVFVDTHFLLAPGNPRDPTATAASAAIAGNLVTTDAVLIELEQAGFKALMR